MIGAVVALLVIVAAALGLFLVNKQRHAADDDAQESKAAAVLVPTFLPMENMVVNLADPEVFVLGGGMSNVGELYDRLPQVVARHVFSDHWDGRIVPAKWGDSSGVRGAARLWDA